MRMLTLFTPLLWASIVLAQTSTPNLTGIWELDMQKSRLTNPALKSLLVKIDQSGPEVTTTFRAHTTAGDGEETHKYRVGSDDNRNTTHGAPMKSSARWDGNALVVESVAKFQDRELHTNDRWTLSGDGKTLTFVERHQFGADPAEEDTFVLAKLVNATWAPMQAPKPIEEAYKNIQVLRGIPSTQLMPIMMAFTRGLGVKCDHCHVPTEFEKDEKPAKATAREMLKMVMKVNGDYFHGGHAVGCWTCHRGSVKPEFAPKDEASR
jgi:hypothetical protein